MTGDEEWNRVLGQRRAYRPCCPRLVEFVRNPSIGANSAYRNGRTSFEDRLLKAGETAEIESESFLYATLEGVAYLGLQRDWQ